MSNNGQNGMLAGLAMTVGGLCGVLAFSVSCLAAQAALFQAESETLVQVLFRLVGGLILLILSIPGMIYMAVVMSASEAGAPTFMVKEDPSVLMRHAIRECPTFCV